MRRSVPCWQNGQRAMASAQTRCNRRAPLQRGAPGLVKHARHQVGGGLGHAPPGTGGAKPTPLAAEREQQLLVAGGTAQPQQAMRQDTTWPRVLACPFHRGREASGVRIGVERGETHLQMSGHDLVQQCLARIMRGIREWCRVQTRCHEGQGFAMIPTLFFYQLVLVALVWLCVMLHWAWPSDPATCPPPSEPTPPEPPHHREPTPFAGLTIEPHCDTCAHGAAPRPQAPATPPPRIVPTRGRRRQGIPPG